MGLGNSKPAPTKPLTERPWRKPYIWNDVVLYNLLSEIGKIKPGEIKPDERPNLLTSGPVGAGKSSFINAVFSIGEKTKVSRALTGSSVSSFTLKYAGYTQKTLLRHFILRDTMGIEPKDGAGFHVDDFIYLVKGHIENKYKFNPASPISPGDSSFREHPLPEDAIHCVIFVISAVDIDGDIPESYIRKIGQLQDKLRMEEIPRILILTKTDLLCEKVKENVKNMFWSAKVQRVVKKASEIFSIDQSSIHPVMNYEVDYTLTPQQSIPLLLALKQSMQYAVDRKKQLRDEVEIR